ncbi:MAG: hypothetical protein LBE67_07630 [Kocuria palustris]|nr:hypothetical protein [Kocuria palustris]
MEFLLRRASDMPFREWRGGDDAVMEPIRCRCWPARRGAAHLAIVRRQKPLDP